jgi:hypothetical protein
MPDPAPATLLPVHVVDKKKGFAPGTGVTAADIKKVKDTLAGKGRRTRRRVKRSRRTRRKT